MDKIQLIEKLFYYINAYYYLLLPILYFIFRNKVRDSAIIALYGLVCSLLLNIYYILPEGYLVDLFMLFYTFAEYTFFTLLILSHINTRKVKMLIMILSMLFLAFQIMFAIRIEIDRLDTISIGIETILLFIYIIYMFYEYFKSAKTNYIYNNHFFWVSLGILIYLGGTFFFNILANHLSRGQLVQYLKLTYVLEMVKTTLFAIAIVICYYQNKDKIFPKPQVPYLDLDIN